MFSSNVTRGAFELCVTVQYPTVDLRLYYMPYLIRGWCGQRRAEAKHHMCVSYLRHSSCLIYMIHEKPAALRGMSRKYHLQKVHHLIINY